MKFEGVGGMVELDTHGDQIESYEVMNYVVRVNGTSSVPVGIYNTTESGFQWVSLAQPGVWMSSHHLQSVIAIKTQTVCTQTCSIIDQNCLFLLFKMLIGVLLFMLNSP